MDQGGGGLISLGLASFLDYSRIQLLTTIVLMYDSHSLLHGWCILMLLALMHWYILDLLNMYKHVQIQT